MKLSGSGNYVTVENNEKGPLVSKLLVVIKQEWENGPQDSASYLKGTKTPKGKKKDKLRKINKTA